MQKGLRALLSASLLCAGIAQAALVKFSFGGQFTDDAINGCGALVACGVVSGSYSFASDAVDGNAAADAD